MWKLEDKYKSCCHNDSCDSFDTCIECWDEWSERNPPMTNADRIRAMNNEELAQIFSDMACKFMCRYCDEYERIKTASVDTRCNGECDKAYLQWLKQPAEEADDG